MAKVKEMNGTAIATLPFLERIDVGLVELARPILENPTVHRIGKIGRMGDDRLLLLLSTCIAVAGLATRNGKLQRTGFRMAMAQLVAKGAKELGKNNVDRTRPETQIEQGRYIAKPGNSRSEALRSFPSGHAASALAVAKAFSREYPHYTKPVLTAAAAVGALQLPRRANYPGDVAAGASAGLVAEKLADGVIMAIKRLQHRRLAQRTEFVAL